MLERLCNVLTAKLVLLTILLQFWSVCVGKCLVKLFYVTESKLQSVLFVWLNRDNIQAYNTFRRKWLRTLIVILVSIEWLENFYQFINQTHTNIFKKQNRKDGLEWRITCRILTNSIISCMSYTRCKRLALKAIMTFIHIYNRKICVLSQSDFINRDEFCAKYLQLRKQSQ